MAGSLADEDTMQAVEGGGNRSFVQFHWKAVQDEAKSLEQGRPIFEDVEYITVTIPGDKYSIVDKRVQEHHRREYFREYQAWKAGEDQDRASGTLLSEWPGVTRAQVEELAYFKIRTVEALAATSDGNLEALGMNGRALRQKARDYLMRANEAAPVSQMRAELDAARGEKEVMQRQLKEQAEAIAELRKQTKHQGRAQT